MRRNIRNSVILLIAGSLAGLCLAEVMVRLLAPQVMEPHPRGFYIADDKIGFRPASHRSGIITTYEWSVKVRTNSLGLRERELDQLPHHSRRILALGDSFTFGAGVEEKAAYPRLIEASLRKSGLPLVVVNSGVSGYGTVQQVRWLVRIIGSVKPDVVLVGFFVGNDFYDNLALNKYQVIDGYLTSTLDHGTRLYLTQKLGISPELKIKLRTHLHLYPLLMNAWTNLLILTGKADTESQYEIYRTDLTENIRNAVDVTRDAFIQLKQISSRMAIPVGVVIIPDARVASIISKRRNYNFARPGNILLDLGNKLGIPVLDLTPLFTDREDLYYPADGHWTREGHQLAADSIASWLTGGPLQIPKKDAVASSIAEF